MHTALARWWREPPAARTPGRAAALVAANWASPGFRDDAQSARWRAASADSVARYVATVDPGCEPRGVERTVGLRTGTLALSGRVDRIDERPTGAGDAGTGDSRAADIEAGDSRAGDIGAGDTELVVVDYKTGRSVPDDDEARGSLALAVYAAAAGRTLRRPATQVELHHLPSGRVASWRHTAVGLARHLARADDIGGELAAAHASWPALAEAGRAVVDAAFPASPGPACSWCDFRLSCPDGRRASPDLPAWAALDDAMLDEPGPLSRLR